MFGWFTLLVNMINVPSWLRFLNSPGMDSRQVIRHRKIAFLLNSVKLQRIPRPLRSSLKQRLHSVGSAIYYWAGLPNVLLSSTMKWMIIPACWHFMKTKWDNLYEAPSNNIYVLNLLVFSNFPECLALWVSVHFWPSSGSWWPLREALCFTFLGLLPTPRTVSFQTREL